MKRLTQITLIAMSFALAFSANAGTSKTDSELLTLCKASVGAQFEKVDRIKLSNLSSRRGVFKAKLKVTADGQRSRVLCTIAPDQSLTLTCTSDANCPVSSIAAN